MTRHYDMGKPSGCHRVQVEPWLRSERAQHHRISRLAGEDLNLLTCKVSAHVHAIFPGSVERPHGAFRDLQCVRCCPARPTCGGPAVLDLRVDLPVARMGKEGVGIVVKRDFLSHLRHIEVRGQHLSTPILVLNVVNERRLDGLDSGRWATRQVEFLARRSVRHLGAPPQRQLELPIQQHLHLIRAVRTELVPLHDRLQVTALLQRI